MLARRAAAEVSVLTGAAGLVSGWSALADAQRGALRGTPVHDLAWARAAHAAGARLVTVVVGDPAAPDALAPLQRVHHRPGHLELSAHGEPIDLLYRDRAALDELCAALVTLGVPLKLWRLPAASPTRAALETAYRRRGRVLVREQPACPVMPLDASWAEPECRFTSKRRSDIRRYRRRAEAIGPVEVELLAPRPDEVPRLMAEAIEVEAAGWKLRAGSALAVDYARRRFFRRWAEFAACEASLRMAFLRIGGRAAAMQLAAECGGALWLLKVGYDEEFARCSPGFLLMLEVVRAAAQRGLERIEFLGEAEPWTSIWCSEQRGTLSVATYPFTAAGGWAFTRDAVTFARNRMRDARVRPEPEEGR